MRLIDADRLKSYIDCGHLRPPAEVCFSELDVCNMIDKAPTVSAEAVQGWIPCSERLPKDNREVLISCEWGIDIGQHEEYGWRSEWINHYDDDNVLAWMPLPTPYKGGDDE